MFTLAHLSDPHLGPIPSPRFLELVGKRWLGYRNWRRRRERHHRAEVVAAIVRDLKTAAPDHIAVTGDLVNIALEREFMPAWNWLDDLGGPAQVTLVPGNHDAYARGTKHHHTRLWAAYMRGDKALPRSSVTFPFLRRRGPVVLIGLSTAVPTLPLMATGRVGAAQLERLTEVMTGLAREGAFRIVLLHHPPVSTNPARHKRLTDAPALLRMLKEHGAELVLHGHDHLHAMVLLEGPTGPIPAIGVPSASAAADGSHHPAAYNLFSIDGGPGNWRCEMVTRGLASGRDGVIELNRLMLPLRSSARRQEPGEREEPSRAHHEA